jgi:hypothetical protein
MFIIPKLYKMRQIFIITLILFSANCVFSQKINISDSIALLENISWNDNKNTPQNILYFNGAHNSNVNNLPIYFYREAIESDKIVKNYKILNVKWETIDENKLSGVKFLDLISDEPTIKVKTSVARKKYYVNIEMIPIRRSSETGKYEQITYFEIEINFEDKSLKTKSLKFASNSMLNQGKWFKFAVNTSGIYKLTYQQIADMGFTDMNNIGIFGFGGLLPQKSDEFFYDDLPERPSVLMDQNSDGVFNSGDYLLFYAEGPDEYSYPNLNSGVQHIKHYYSDKAYYFVSDQGSLKQPENIASVSGANVFVNSFDDYKVSEVDSINVINMGRTWYWRHFDYYTTHTFSQSFPNRIVEEQINMDVYVAARSSNNSTFDVSCNGVELGSIGITYVTGAYSSAHAKTRNQTFQFQTAGDNLNISLVYNKTASDSEGWLDFIRTNVRRELKMSGDFMIFRDTRSVGSGNVAQFTIQNAGNDFVVMDITDPVNAAKINTSVSSGNTVFSANASELKEYIIFNKNANFSSPIISGSGTGVIQNQNLHALSNPDLIIVTYSGFESYAQQLANLHETYEDLDVLVLTPQEIYNEYSSGTPDITAIRNFVKMFYDRAANESDIPQNLLLFGDGSFDNKANPGTHGNFVPTYQALNPFSPSASFVCDDYYVLLDDGEGSVDGTEDLDMGVGRLTVKSASESQIVINKIAEYYSQQHLGNWRNVVCFIGDDAEDYTTHQEQTNLLTVQVENNYPVYNVNKIFLDAYEQVQTVQGARYPEVNELIDNQVQRGALIMNYTGHGNTKTLAHEVVVDLSQINSWYNPDRLAIFVTATCEFSRFDDYEIVSAGEQILLNENGGGVALFSTSRLVQAFSNFELNKKFYNHFFVKDENLNAQTLGSIIMKTKNDLPSDGNKRNFALLGNPALKPAIPRYNVVTTSINGVEVESFTDTLSAQNLVTITGYVEDQFGNLMNDFNGILYPTVYDKRMNFQTRGNDGRPPLNYNLQNNILFKGKSSVINGEFRFQFIVPIDIAYFYDYGKISYYAKENSEDAHGYFDGIVIGGSSDNIITDNDPPEIELYMNNEDFVIGGITDENPKMLAFVSDSSGINTVGSGIGHDITAVLDENTSNTIILNEYYESELDDYTSGVINYPFNSLPLGPHTLKLKVWDVLNNSSEATTEFIVASSSELVIDHVFNYPNPFSTSTEFYFEHNQPNNPLDVLIQVFTVSGKLVKTLEAIVVSDGYRSQPIAWNSLDDYGDKLGKGVYIYRLKVRAPNGNVVDKFEKLVILN